MNSRLRRLRMAVSLLSVIAVWATASGCSERSEAGSAADPAQSRHFVEDFFLARAEGAQWSPGWYRTLDEVLPNVRYQRPTGEQSGVAEYAVIGRISRVEKGKGFRPEGVDGAPVGFDDGRARWWSAHVTVSVERTLGPETPGEVTLMLPSPGPRDFATMAEGLKALGRVAVLLQRRSLLTAYDDSLYAVVNDRGPLVATVAADGALALPLVPAESAGPLLAKTPNLRDLEAASRLPRVILMTGSPGDYRRADGL